MAVVLQDHLRLDVSTSFTASGATQKALDDGAGPA